VAAGLGGGSSDAAVVLKGANWLAGGPLNGEELAELGLELGADVPFFLSSGPAWARGVGEILTPVNLPPFHYLLINPGFGISTKWAFRELRMPLTPSRGLAKVEVPVLGGRGEGLYGPLRRLPNDLEPVVEKARPVVARLKESLTGAGAKLARMSGSGPTVFGLFETEAEATRAAGSILKEAEDLDRPWRILLTRGLV
jgi:4-diphosphocytidyl-2-C-methyl-D-erythritol kinase